MLCFILFSLIASINVVIMTHGATMSSLLTVLDLMRNDTILQGETDFIFWQQRDIINSSRLGILLNNNSIQPKVFTDADTVYHDISDYIAETYIKQGITPKYYLYADALKLHGEFVIFKRNNIEEYDVILSCEGTKTYDVYYETYKTSYDMERLKSEYYSIKNSDYDPLLDQVSSQYGIYTDYPFAAAAVHDEKKHVRMLVPEPRYLAGIENYGININDYNVSSVFRNFTDDQMTTLHEVFDFNLNDFKNQYIKNDTFNILWIGSNYIYEFSTNKQRSFQTFLRMFKSQYPRSNVIYKPHPSHVDSLSKSWQSIIVQYNIKLFLNQIPGELLLLSIDELYIGGSISSSMMSVERDKIHFILNGESPISEPFSSLNSSYGFFDKTAVFDDDLITFATCTMSSINSTDDVVGDDDNDGSGNTSDGGSDSFDKYESSNVKTAMITICSVLGVIVLVTAGLFLYSKVCK